MIRAIAFGAVFCWSFNAEAESLLIENVRIFDGVNATLKPGHVLVDDGIITRVSSKKIDTADDAKIIDGANRVLSPGFIDLHAHLTMHVPPSQGDAQATSESAKVIRMAGRLNQHGNFGEIREERYRRID